MNPRPSLKVGWLEAFTRFWRMWMLGWLTVGKFLLVAAIFWFGYVPAGFCGQF